MSRECGVLPNSSQSAIRNPQSIAIVGASARAAAFSVLRSGRRAVAADLFADADLAQHCPAARISPYPAGFADWLATTECDGWMYTGAMENYPDLVDRLAEIHPLLGNSGDALRLCRDPLLLQEIFRENDLYFPETQKSCAGLPMDGSWLCKTYRGSSGSGVWELTVEGTRQRAKKCSTYFQKHVEGRPTSAIFALGEDWTETLGVTAQWVGASACGATRFQYAGSLGIQQELPPLLHEQLQKLSHMLSTRLRLRGLVGVDLILDNDRAWILEINPRYTASVEIVERMKGASAIDAHVAACLGTESATAWRQQPSKQNHGKAIHYARQDVAIGGKFFAWAMTQTGVSLGSGLADIPAVGSRIPRGRPVLTVFASAEETAGESFLRQRIAEVEAQLYGST